MVFKSPSEPVPASPDFKSGNSFREAWGGFYKGAWGGFVLPEWSSHPRNLSRTTGGAWGGFFLWNWSGFRGAGGQKKPAEQERASYIQVRKG